MHKLHEQVNTLIGRVLTLSREDLKREDGQGATEYGLVIAFVVVGLAITIGVLGTSIKAFLAGVAGKLDAITAAL
jgi:Flp pilus assembly pilin Flp